MEGHPRTVVSKVLPCFQSSLFLTQNFLCGDLALVEHSDHCTKVVLFSRMGQWSRSSDRPWGNGQQSGGTSAPSCQLESWSPRRLRGEGKRRRKKGVVRGEKRREEKKE